MAPRSSPYMVPAPPDGLLEKRKKDGFEFYDWAKWPHKAEDWKDTQRRWEDGAAIAQLLEALPTGWGIGIHIFNPDGTHREKMDAELPEYKESNNLPVHVFVKSDMQSSPAVVRGYGETLVEALAACKLALLEWEESMKDARTELEGLQN